MTLAGRCTAERLIAFVTLAAILAVPASGQSNAFRGKTPPAPPSAGSPTSQPAFRSMRAEGPAVRAPHRPAPGKELMPVNPVLRRASLISVEMPEPESIALHDLVTIIVREDKRFSTDSKLKSEKEWTVQSALQQWFRLDKDDKLVAQNFPGGAPGVDFSFEHEYEGKGRVDRKDSLVLRIQAKVIDVKPNGNLVIEARKRITVDEEDQIATLTGVCRSVDVSAQNTVLSTQVADLEISIKHTGAARDASRRGWLMRVFDLLRPI